MSSIWEYVEAGNDTWRLKWPIRIVPSYIRWAVKKRYALDIFEVMVNVWRCASSLRNTGVRQTWPSRCQDKIEHKTIVRLCFSEWVVYVIVMQKHARDYHRPTYHQQWNSHCHFVSKLFNYRNPFWVSCPRIIPAFVCFPINWSRKKSIQV